MVGDRAAHGISVALLRPIAELLGRLGLEPDRFLAALEIDDGSAPDTYVSGEHVDQLLDELAVRRGDPALGLTLAQLAIARPLGLFSHLLWLSGTIRDALTRAVRFYPMVSRRTLLVLEEAGGIATVRQQRIPGASRGAILTEFPFASLALRARAETAGQFALRAVRFVHGAAQRPMAAYREVFAAPVTFGAAGDELEMDAAELDRPITSADAITSAALEAQIAELRTSAMVRSPFLDRARRVAAANLTTHASLATFGAQLGISARTLRRQLAQEGTSLRALVDEVRRERADELLATGTPVKEIAFALGFSEPSAFSRAYKRWTGHAPGLGGQSGH
ncbi:MAG: AraC family transcriptional regulator [Myxococcota bacterium]|nr:AraC family transcriptional regulator [Myxococcota bacterium]